MKKSILGSLGEASEAKSFVSLEEDRMTDDRRSWGLF